MSSTDPLIHLSDVKKVFYTDEVETHALSGIHLDIQKVNTFPSPALQAVASRPCCRFLAYSTRRATGSMC